MKSEYGVFIIESLDDGDYFDGEVLKEVLELAKVQVEYKKIHDKIELKDALKEFSESQFRYLHISCHASDEIIQLTDETLVYQEFGELVSEKIRNKRIFLSACNAGNEKFASMMIRYGAYSVTGSPIKIHFDKAVLFWASFFHVVNYLDEVLNYDYEPSMRRNEIKAALKSCVELFQIPINYFSYIKEDPNKMRRLEIKPTLPMKSITDSRKISLK